MFQEVVDPGYSRTGSSQYNPNWFGFAPWASLQVGYGERAAKEVLNAIDQVGAVVMMVVLVNVGI